MNNQYALLYGQLQTSLDFSALADGLASMNIVARVGQSSHYMGGRYLRITCGQTELTFEKIEDLEYLINGESPTLAEMNLVARLVSDALQQSGQKHRMEIYLSSESAHMSGYFHFSWPRDESLL